MRRQDKYPETNTFHYYNPNPKGKITTDCVIRALCAATGKDYKTVVMDMAMLQCETGYDDGDVKAYSKYLERNGFTKMNMPRHDDNTRYTVKQFVDSHRTGTYLLNMANHLVACVDGKIYDIWDCYKSGKCVGNYWVKG